jgi:hypothetical protein
VFKEPKELKAAKELKVLLDLKAAKELKVSKDSRVQPEVQALREVRVLSEVLACRDPKVQLALRERQAQQFLLGPLVKQVVPRPLQSALRLRRRLYLGHKVMR